MFFKTYLSSIRRLKNDKGFIKYFTNTSWLLFEKGFKVVNILLIGVLLARYLGPAQYGILSYSLAYVFLFSALAKLGLDSIVVKALVKHESERDSILGTSFVLKFFSSILSIVILLCTSSLLHDNEEKKLILILSLALLFLSFSVVDFFFQSKVLSRLSVYASIFSITLSIILKLLLIIYKASLISFAFAFLFEAILLSIGYLGFYMIHGLSFKNWQFNRDWALKLLKDSYPLMLAGIFIVIYMKIDQIMIKSILDSSEVGKYAAAVTLSEGWYFFPMIIVTSLFPAIINAKESNKGLYYTRLSSLYRFMFWLALIIAIPITLFADWIINTCYGVNYLEAAQILKIHIWAGIFVFLGVSSSRWLIVEDLQIFSIINTAIGAVLNIILNYILIHKYGIVGAAWATLVSYFFSGYFSYLFFKRTRPNFVFVNKSIFLFKKHE